MPNRKRYGTAPGLGQASQQLFEEVRFTPLQQNISANSWGPSRRGTGIQETFLYSMQLRIRKQKEIDSVLIHVSSRQFVKKTPQNYASTVVLLPYCYQIEGYASCCTQQHKITNTWSRLGTAPKQIICEI